MLKPDEGPTLLADEEDSETGLPSVLLLELELTAVVSGTEAEEVVAPVLNETEEEDAPVLGGMEELALELEVSALTVTMTVV